MESADESEVILKRRKCAVASYLLCYRGSQCHSRIYLEAQWPRACMRRDGV